MEFVLESRAWPSKIDVQANLDAGSYPFLFLPKTIMNTPNSLSLSTADYTMGQ